MRKPIALERPRIGRCSGGKPQPRQSYRRTLLVVVSALGGVILPLAGCAAPQARSQGAERQVEEAWFPECLPASGGVELPCFTGGAASSVKGPAVVNLWASWCAPCRQELPVFQRLANTDRVRVIGVATLDDRPRTLSAARDMEVRFPMLYDPEGKLQKTTGKSLLPITLFVDADGKVMHTYTGPALDDEALARLVEEHL